MIRQIRKTCIMGGSASKKEYIPNMKPRAQNPQIYWGTAQKFEVQSFGKWSVSGQIFKFIASAAFGQPEDNKWL